MPDYSIRPAEWADIEHIAASLRPEHRREAALVGLDGADALRHSFAYAAWCYAFLADAEPLFVAGVMEADLMDGTALAWMAGTLAMNDHAFPILEAGPRILPLLHHDAARIENHVPTDYRKAVKFALRLGCKSGGASMRGGVPHVHLYHDTKEDA